MNNIKAINEVYEYLLYVKSITDTQYINIEKIERRKAKGLTPQTLIKHDILLPYNSKKNAPRTNDVKCMWGNHICDFTLAYNYYYDIRNKTKRFADIETIIRNPEKHEFQSYYDALKYKALQNKSRGNKITVPETISIGFNINKNGGNHISDENSKNHLNMNTNQTNKRKFYTLMESIENNFVESLEGNNVIINITKALLENTEAIIDTNREIQRENKALQNTNSAMFQMLRISQENLFMLNAVVMNLIIMWFDDINIELLTCDDDKKFILNAKKEKMGVVMKNLRDIVNKNNNVIARYGVYK